MGNSSVPKFIFSLSRFPVYRGSVLGRFYCIILNISFMFLLYTLFPIHLLLVHCHSCAISPYCVSPTAGILSPFPIPHHFPPSSAYCYNLKREITRLIHICEAMGSKIPPKITLHIHLSDNLRCLKHKG
jgi:hypothetical protein